MSLSNNESKVLKVIKKSNRFDDIVKNSSLKDVEVMRALQWLSNKGILNIEKNVNESVVLGENGKKYKNKGLPERILINFLNEKKECKIGDLKESGLSKDEINIAIGILRKKGAVEIRDNKLRITKTGIDLQRKEWIEERFIKKLPLDISKLLPEEKHSYNELIKRKDIIKKELTKYIYVKLTNIGKGILKDVGKIKEVIDNVTPDVIRNKKWKNKRFKIYDIKIDVPKIFGGRRHFINDAIDFVKNVWVGMGFKEMKGNIVDTCFWNFDSLFVPQDHPAREMQDTFYLPMYGKLPSKEIVEKVKNVHENGWKTGSKGWGYKWDEKKAKKLVLRTHTTVLSSKTLASLKKDDMPAKFFSIGKCFRNETLDWKHLFEFNQVEGIVVGYVNFRHLIGYLKEFYNKLGFKNIRIRPAYFPYTEPSAEIEVFHPIRKEWVEYGGAGMFRPEVVKPLLSHIKGIDLDNINVLAWGFGFARIVTDYYKLNDLRELYKNDLNQLRYMKKFI